MITVVLTSCNRPALLKRTLESFFKFNTYPIKEFIVIEDSGNPDMRNIIEAYPVKLLYNVHNIGQIPSIDKAYSKVITPYIFHCEDDWEFYRPGFIEASLEVLKADGNVINVWLREQSDTNGHPIEPQVMKAGAVEYKYLQTNAVGGYWHGFTWNPSLRRLADYYKIGTFERFMNEVPEKHKGGDNAYYEMIIGDEYYNRYGLRGAILLNGYVKHIG